MVFSNLFNVIWCRALSDKHISTHYISVMCLLSNKCQDYCHKVNIY